MSRSEAQSWSLDIALAQGGFDALHPEGKNTLLQLGTTRPISTPCSNR
ncbi:Uncharacterised protein [Chromobacterium violaceum]|uniref:Uncharacterized protein n=1 Tax=Chromobacterium violaceum TaxID=536 RepID=A0A3S4I454_CHRVL|nr:Uncharacterised protein [Chromobacterium violaceum]